MAKKGIPECDRCGEQLPIRLLSEAKDGRPMRLAVSFRIVEVEHQSPQGCYIVPMHVDEKCERIMEHQAANAPKPGEPGPLFLGVDPGSPEGDRQLEVTVDQETGGVVHEVAPDGEEEGRG